MNHFLIVFNMLSGERMTVHYIINTTIFLLV